MDLTHFKHSTFSELKISWRYTTPLPDPKLLLMVHRGDEILIEGATEPKNACRVQSLNSKVLN